jgi:hypothetical protein
LRLLQCGLGRTRIDAEQQLILCDVAAILDERFEDLSVDQRFHRDAVDRLDAADRAQQHGHVLPHGLDDRNRRRRRDVRRRIARAGDERRAQQYRRDSCEQNARESPARHAVAILKRRMAPF